MGKARIGIPGHRAAIGIFGAFILLISCCAAPRIVVFDDPLSAEEHNELGVIYEQKGMYDLAEKEYKQASAKEKAWAIPYFNLGNLAYKKGDLKLAEGYYHKALDPEGTNPDIMNNLANVFIDLGRREEAQAMIEQALAIRQKDEYLDTYQKIKGYK